MNKLTGLSEVEASAAIRTSPSRQKESAPTQDDSYHYPPLALLDDRRVADDSSAEQEQGRPSFW